LIRAVLFDLGDTLANEGTITGRHLWQGTLQKLPFAQVLSELARAKQQEERKYGEQKVVEYMEARAKEFDTKQNEESSIVLIERLTDLEERKRMWLWVDSA